MACPALSFINIGVFSFAWETLSVMRHFLSFTHVVPLPFQCTRRVFNKFLLRGDAHPTVVDGVGSQVGTIPFVASLGNLYRLNATRLAFRIRSKAGGYFSYVQTIQSFQIPKPPAAFKVFITSAIQTLVSEMLEAKVGVKGPHPLQKHWVSPRLKMTQSGQGRRRLKTALPFRKAGEKPPLPSAKIRSRYWSH